MTELVIDASVAVKWMIAEDHTPEALSLLGSGFTLHSPAHWLAEAANMLWARCTIHRQIEVGELRARIAYLLTIPVVAAPLAELTAEAVEVSQILRSTVYDTLYVVLAMRRRSTLVTADRRLIASAEAAGEPYRGCTRWIGEGARS